jgi:hypothetical protein
MSHSRLSGGGGPQRDAGARQDGIPQPCTAQGSCVSSLSTVAGCRYNTYSHAVQESSKCQVLEAGRSQPLAYVAQGQVDFDRRCRSPYASM